MTNTNSKKIGNDHVRIVQDFFLCSCGNQHKIKVELYYSQPIDEHSHVQEEHPTLPIILTFTCPTYQQMAETIMEFDNYYGYIPEKTQLVEVR
ncbi:MAG TPA: hypothetical protein VFX18_01975 [Candidatus Nitrosocosmicus sp.]|nr:hypothetical protein [Candidatus Nitrosocosmicus sp.]